MIVYQVSVVRGKDAKLDAWGVAESLDAAIKYAEKQVPFQRVLIVVGDDDDGYWQVDGEDAFGPWVVTITEEELIR